MNTEALCPHGLHSSRELHNEHDVEYAGRWYHGQEGVGGGKQGKEAGKCWGEEERSVLSR